MNLKIFGKIIKSYIYMLTIDSDLPRDIEEKQEPCMCAQMAEHWTAFYEGRDTPDIRYNLKSEANPKCFHCHGTGVETVGHEVGIPTINLNYRNAKVLFEILGININGPDGMVGEITIPEARRAVMRGRSKQNLAKFIAPECKQYGKPREIEPGVIDMRPLRMFECGLTEDKIRSMIQEFAALVLEVSHRGATKIFWT
jgi:hypothetical protein